MRRAFLLAVFAAAVATATLLPPGPMSVAADKADPRPKPKAKKKKVKAAAVRKKAPAGPAADEKKAAAKKGSAGAQGQGVVIELDEEFIRKYENRVTMETTFVPKGMSQVHTPAKDGEVHIGGWSHEAGLPTVAEVMNAEKGLPGEAARRVFAKALSAGKPVTTAGAWRLWCEHTGEGAQVQARNTDPTYPLPGQYASNPDHVFEIHPVTRVTYDGQTADALDAIGDIDGFTPKDAQTAFFQVYEKLSCKIVPVKAKNRVRIITEEVGYNFTRFQIRLNEDPFRLDDGHGVICTVADTDGEVLLRRRRMVFIQGTEADALVAGAREGDRFEVLGMPRISLKLVRWRLDHADDTNDDGTKKYDISPLDWRLPYEMIVVHAAPLGGDG